MPYEGLYEYITTASQDNTISNYSILKYNGMHKIKRKLKVLKESTNYQPLFEVVAFQRP